MFRAQYQTTVSPDLLLPLDRWGDNESTSTFCEEFTAWETLWSGGGGSGEDNRVAIAAETDVEVAAKGSAGGTALPAVSTRRRQSGTPQSGSRLPLESFDFILAGDVLYKHCLLDPFLGTVRDMLAPDGRMLLCHVPRAGVTYGIVERAFAEAGFTFEILNGDKKLTNGESCSEEDQDPEGDGRSGLAVEAAHGSRCDTTAVGGVELCVDDARRARLYEVRFFS